MPNEEESIDPIRGFFDAIKSKHGTADKALQARGIRPSTKGGGWTWTHVSVDEMFGVPPHVDDKPLTLNDEPSKMRAFFIGGPCNGCLHRVSRDDNVYVIAIAGPGGTTMYQYRRLETWPWMMLTGWSAEESPGAPFYFFYCGDQSMLTIDGVSAAFSDAVAKGWTPQEAM